MTDVPLKGPLTCKTDNTYSNNRSIFQFAISQSQHWTQTHRLNSQREIQFFQQANEQSSDLWHKSQTNTFLFQNRQEVELVQGSKEMSILGPRGFCSSYGCMTNGKQFTRIVGNVGFDYAAEYWTLEAVKTVDVLWGVCSPLGTLESWSTLVNTDHWLLVSVCAANKLTGNKWVAGGRVIGWGRTVGGTKAVTERGGSMIMHHNLLILPVSLNMQTTRVLLDAAVKRCTETGQFWFLCYWDQLLKIMHVFDGWMDDVTFISRSVSKS